jgi:two-component system NtrC family sensor kinase
MNLPATKSLRMPVLLIEDEEGVMIFVRATLESRGYLVVAARSGVEALRLLEQDCFQGVVSDMSTPGGVSGADVYSWITKNRPQLANRVVFITGDIANEQTVAILNKTGAPCVEKPFRVQHFISVVEDTMGKPQ